MSYLENECHWFEYADAIPNYSKLTSAAVKQYDNSHEEYFNSNSTTSTEPFYENNLQRHNLENSSSSSVNSIINFKDYNEETLDNYSEATTNKDNFLYIPNKNKDVCNVKNFNSSENLESISLNDFNYWDANTSNKKPDDIHTVNNRPESSTALEFPNICMMNSPSFSAIPCNSVPPQSYSQDMAPIVFVSSTDEVTKALNTSVSWRNDQSLSKIDENLRSTQPSSLATVNYDYSVASNYSVKDKKMSCPEEMNYECFEEKKTRRRQPVRKSTQKKHDVVNHVNGDQHEPIKKKKKIENKRSAFLPAICACAICRLSFDTAALLSAHARICHPDERAFGCHDCDSRFLKESGLKLHCLKHTGQKPQECETCGKRFRLLSTLKSHVLTHTGEKPFACDVCEATFTQMAALKRHCRNVHNDPTMRPYICEHCGSAFRDKSYLRKHIASHELKAKHTCSVCDRGFYTEKRLQLHVRCHNTGPELFTCTKCNKRLRSQKAWLQHRLRVHERRDALRCSDCDAAFSRREALRSHKKVHLGPNLVKCDHCQASFKHLCTLRKHVKKHENQFKANDSSGSRGEVCLKCGITLSSERQLRTHKCVSKDFSQSAYDEQLDHAFDNDNRSSYSTDDNHSSNTSSSSEMAKNVDHLLGKLKKHSESNPLSEKCNLPSLERTIIMNKTDSDVNSYASMSFSKCGIVTGKSKAVELLSAVFEATDNAYKAKEIGSSFH